jgi:branched-chain amino acid transport system permease protein
MSDKSTSFWKKAMTTGLLGGGLSVYLALVGMTEAFGERYIINGVITMGQVFLLAPIFLMAYMASRRESKLPPRKILLVGLVAGFFSGAMLFAFLLLGNLINLRSMFINASPALYQIMTFGLGFPAGLIVPLVYGVVLGLIAAGIYLLPSRIRSAVIQAIVWVVLIGLLRDLLTTVIVRWGPVGLVFKWLFANNGLSIIGAIALFVIVAGVSYWRSGKPKSTGSNRFTANPRARWAFIILGIVLLLLIPPLLGIFFSEAMNNVGLYILMGLGLNIVVGYAGLLDLGYVAFYAIGAYTMGVLTSPGLGYFHFTFWEALPFSLIMALLAGVILGLPVLRLRGDYLAIVTLGFGEIVRLLFLSDWLRPYVGGTQGIQSIAQPKIGPLTISTPQQFFYLIMICIAIVLFIAWRMKDSRIGRAWMALREDEDVAQAMGLNLVITKLLAFASGALFAGLAGAIFSSKLVSVYPHSMNFMVSINVLSLIIIGGMGSVPGVVVGALALVGFPEILREFSEYRLLVYGAVLVAMMLFRPEGLWPEARRKLELHEEAEILAE